MSARGPKNIRKSRRERYLRFDPGAGAERPRRSGARREAARSSPAESSVRVGMALDACETPLQSSFSRAQLG